MVWVIILVFLPFVLLIGGILFFNIYLRKQITKDTTPAPTLDQAYIEAERAAPEDEEFVGTSDKAEENKEGRESL